MKKTILVVDDSESIREMVGFVLKEANYEVKMGVDGDDALKHFDGNPIDLVITDLNMPNMNGIDLIRRIRCKDCYKYIPILLLTTESQTAKKSEARFAGATGWIVKPFVQEKLLQTVERVMR